MQQALLHHQPQYHFYGHYGGPYSYHLEANGITNSYKLTDLTWEHEKREQDHVSGFMGVLHWHHSDAHAFEIKDNAHAR